MSRSASANDPTQDHPPAAAFVVHDARARDLFGPSPTLELLHEDPSCPFAHEAGVFVHETNTLFVTSNRFTDPETQTRRVRITRARLPDDDDDDDEDTDRRPNGGSGSSDNNNSRPNGGSGSSNDNTTSRPNGIRNGNNTTSQPNGIRNGNDNTTSQPNGIRNGNDNTTSQPSRRISCQEAHPSDAPIPMANGAVNYKDGILFCAQGDARHPGGLALMAAAPPHATRYLLTSFHGRPFNSVNDVVVHSDGSVWFTDPIYGFEQGFRPPPRLPSQVYRFDPERGSVRAMADGFGRPNGICFSPDEKTVYVTDTDRIHGDGTADEFRASHIYAFDLTHYASSPFLTNRRLFAMADTGVPDGIKCDVHGNVYSGCGDGINIWSPGGVLLGKIMVEGGVANFCFGREGTLFLLNEHRLWRATLARHTKGALLGI